MLVAGKGEKAIPEEETELPDEPCISTKRKSQVIVVGDSPLGVQKVQFADLICCLGRCGACWELGSSMSQRNKARLALVLFLLLLNYIGSINTSGARTLSISEVTGWLWE